MNKQSLFFGIGGLVAGGAIMWAVATYAVNGNHMSMADKMGMHMTMTSSSSGSNMTMQDMVSSLKGKSGDQFDKAFIADMITHHQGAIDMANLAKKNAKHQEIKNMADDIVTAQSKEIDQMKMWQGEWGYASSSSSHDMMQMSH